jgi:hypothetical protein
MEEAMSLAITLVIALILLLLLLVGAWRDIPRGLLALVATLFGTVLGGFWTERWGNELAARFDTGPSPIIGGIGILLISSVVLLIGYGGGIVLPPSPKLLTWQERVIGGALGLLNGIVLTGYLLRLSTYGNPGFAALIGSSALATLLYDGIPLLFLAVAIVGSSIIIGKGIVIALRNRATTPFIPPDSETPGSAPQITKAERRENQKRALEKIKDRTS